MSSQSSETEDFLDALTAINLRRIWIILLVGAGLDVAVFSVDFLLAKWSEVTKVAGGDLLLSGLMILIVALIRRQPRRGRWPRLFVVGFTLVWLATMDVYYFSAFAAGTHNASYAIGVMCAAVFFLLPPAVFLPVLGLNHVFYCAWLLLTHDAAGKVAVPLMDGTVCMAVAGLASWFLFHAARENFFKERTIAERNRALAASNDELREVMAIAAHDLRSPLLALRNLLGLARREPGAEQGKLAQVLTLATDSCSAMVQLVSRLVEAHAAEETSTKLPLVPQDLRNGCSAAVERLRATADAKGQRIALALPDTPAIAPVDAATFTQVIENLLGNALKFSSRETTVECAIVTREGGWRVEVRDEGPGVPPEERERLWQKFHRGSARPTGDESSTGLGLHIVKTLTQAMGGRVTYAAREPRGSVFGVELAAARDGMAPAR